ncbi:proteasome activator pa28, REG alpha/beta subunit [Favolaschia claudopus]|uniref:Proteasome activator pa28, REG alpha/beta subunit n=1 Tax=Favolaschia claudopus TaxID=2862362 RepID=A0AAW0EGE0_9AGAR
MDQQLAAQLQAFQKQATSAGENVVFRVFPAKVLELQELIQSTSLPNSPYHKDQTSMTTDPAVYPPPESSSVNGDLPQSKKRRIENDTSSPQTTGPREDVQFPHLVQPNQHLVTLHETLKRECEELVALTDHVKLWISLTMPKIEGGDNFGVQIQEEVVAELLRSQESAFNLRESVKNHHLARAKICSKRIKYPNLEDYALSLKEHDEGQSYLARQHLNDLRNIYAVLTDLIHKNIAKIRAPRGNNSIGLY